MSKSAKQRRQEYYHGLSGKRYGIWNDVQKQFQFGIDESSPHKAKKALFKKISYDSYKWRFIAKELPPTQPASTRSGMP